MYHGGKDSRWASATCSGHFKNSDRERERESVWNVGPSPDTCRRYPHPWRAGPQLSLCPRRPTAPRAPRSLCSAAPGGCAATGPAAGRSPAAASPPAPRSGRRSASGRSRSWCCRRKPCCSAALLMRRRRTGIPFYRVSLRHGKCSSAAPPLDGSVSSSLSFFLCNGGWHLTSTVQYRHLLCWSVGQRVSVRENIKGIVHWKM